MNEKKKNIDLDLLRLLAPYFKKKIWTAIFAALFLVAANLLQISIPKLIGDGIDQAIIPGDLDKLYWLSTLFGGAIILFFISQSANVFLMEFLGQKILYFVRMDVLKKAFRLSSRYFDKNPVGKTLTHLTSDVESIRQAISEGAVNILGDLLLLVFIITTMFLINWVLALSILLISLPLFIITTIIFRNSIRSGFRNVRESNSRINSHMVESLNGIREVQIFNKKTERIDRFETHNRSYLNAFLSIVHAYAIYFPLIEFISNLSLVLVLVLSHFFIDYGLYVSQGHIFSFFLYMNMFFRPLRGLAENFNTFQGAFAALERIKTFMDKEEDLSDVKNPKALPENLEGSIEFKDVHFSYNPETPVLKGLSFNIKAGEKIAIVGSTGAGKSTITHLLNRLYDIQTGDIKIDDSDIYQVKMNDLRKVIATVPQDATLFNGSIRENVALFSDEYSQADVERAIDISQVRHLVSQLENGLDANVQEEGAALSSGQKQLIAFARAFLKNPKILILDEATASIDSETELLLEKAMDNLMHQRTSIVIAHRLSTIKKVDRIFVLHKGQLVEEGNHDELIKQGGVYARLYKMQSLAQSMQ